MSLESYPQLTLYQEYHRDSSGVILIKPEGWDYGYVLGTKTIGCTRERLIDLIYTGQVVDFVWTPESSEPVPPERVAFLREIFREKLRKEGRDNLLWGVGVFAFAIMLVFIDPQRDRLIYSACFAVAGVVLIEGLWRYHRSRHYTEAEATSDANAARFETWLKKKDLSVYTIALMTSIVLVGACEAFVADPIKAAGLVKPAVWNGEAWRLFTAPLVHAGLPYFAVSLAVLNRVSKIIEQTVNRYWVPIVFLLTASTGSIFSLFLYPDVTSIGASGGLMGLLGFVTIAAYFDKPRYPAKYLRQMIEIIILGGVAGLYGFEFVDNGNHLGGLMSGVVLGLLFLRGNAQRDEKLIEFGGRAAIIALMVITAFTLHRLMTFG